MGEPTSLQPSPIEDEPLRDSFSSDDNLSISGLGPEESPKHSQVAAESTTVHTEDSLEALEHIVLKEEGVSNKEKAEAYGKILNVASSKIFPDLDLSTAAGRRIRAVELSFQHYHRFSRDFPVKRLIPLLDDSEEKIRTLAYHNLSGITFFCFSDPSSVECNALKDVIFSNLQKTLRTNKYASPEEAAAIIRAVSHILKKYADVFVHDLFDDQRILQGSLLWLADHYDSVTLDWGNLWYTPRVKIAIQKAMTMRIKTEFAGTPLDDPKALTLGFTTELIEFFNQFLNDTPSSGNLSLLNAWLGGPRPDVFTENPSGMASRSYRGPRSSRSPHTGRSKNKATPDSTTGNRKKRKVVDGLAPPALESSPFKHGDDGKPSAGTSKRHRGSPGPISPKSQHEDVSGDSSNVQTQNMEDDQTSTSHAVGGYLGKNFDPHYKSRLAARGRVYRGGRGGWRGQPKF